MNKFEKLIEYHLNGETAKAKKLFHEITVETSRKIYESLRDDELSRDSDEVGDFIDEVDFDQKGLEENDEFDPEFNDDGEEFSDDEFGDEGSDESEFDPELDDGNDDPEFSDDTETGNDELEDRVIDLETAIDELKAEFDELMADENSEETDDEFEFGDDDVESDETDDENEFDIDDTDDEPSDEENDFDVDEPEPEDDVKESRRPMKTSSERIREYVEKVSDGHGAEKKGAGEGHEIGKGKGFTANKQSIVAKKNDMGGTTANIAKGGSNPDPDGTTPKGKAGGFLKNAQEIDVAKRNVNKVGGSKTSTSGYTQNKQEYANNHQKDGKMVGESRRRNKPVLNSTRTRRAK